LLWFQSDDIGEAYQDEENMAALLVHRNAKDGGVLVVSTTLPSTFVSGFEKRRSSH
jgi:hypothetical protein